MFSNLRVEAAPNHFFLGRLQSAESELGRLGVLESPVVLEALGTAVGSPKSQGNELI